MYVVPPGLEHLQGYVRRCVAAASRQSAVHAACLPLRLPVFVFTLRSHDVLFDCSDGPGLPNLPFNQSLPAPCAPSLKSLWPPVAPPPLAPCACASHMALATSSC